MRRAISLLAVVILTITGLTIPVWNASDVGDYAVASKLTAIALTGIDSSALRDPSALDQYTNSDVIDPTVAKDALAADAFMPLTDDEDESLALAEAAKDVRGGDSSSIAPGDLTKPRILAAINPQRTTPKFMITGVTWDRKTDVDVLEVAVRVREGGVWGGWTRLDAENLVEGDDYRAGTEPLTTTGADGVQARVKTSDGRVPSGMQIEVIDPGESKNDGKVASLPAAAAFATTGSELKPKIVTRAQWGANEKYARGWNEFSNGLKSLYVHHTAGTNSYNRQQSPQLMRGILSYHTQAMRWPDIGYQFIVDKFGTIYQGRRDTVYDNPVGAQVGGYNSQTIGVSAMGNYQIVKPTAELVDAIEQVLAWKVYQYNLDPNGTTLLQAGTSSRSQVRARSGTWSRVNVIQAHRDTNYTACPGTYLYSKMPEIRKNVTERIEEMTVKAGSSQELLPSPVVLTPSSGKTPIQWDATTTYSWAKVKGATRYQVLYRASTYSGAIPDMKVWYLYKTVKSTSVKVNSKRSSNRILAVRAVDSQGRMSAVSLITHSARPVASSKLRPADASKKQWSKATSKAYWGGMAHTTRKKGAKLVVKGVKSANHVYIRAEKSPKAGAIRVTIDGLSKTVSLKTKNATNKRAIIKITSNSTRSGTLTITTMGTERVSLSAVGIGRKQVAKPGVRSAVPAAPQPNSTLPSAEVVVRTPTTPVKWRTTANATGYAIYSRTSPLNGGFGPWSRIGKTSATSFAVPVTQGTTQEIAVLAIRGSGLSPATILTRVTTPIPLSSFVETKYGWIAKRNAANGQISQWTYHPTEPAHDKPYKVARLRLPDMSKVSALKLRMPTGAGAGDFTVTVNDSVKVAAVDLAKVVPAADGMISVPFATPVTGAIRIVASSPLAFSLTEVVALRTLP